jgi:hypothetical protein
MKPRITEFEQGPFGCWYWTVEYDSPDGTRSQRRYRTNNEHEGLWEDDRQVLGLAQFSLPHDRTRARRKVYDQFVRNRTDDGVSLDW